MAITVTDKNLCNRTNRKRLEIRKAPYWRILHEGLHIGYRKGTRGGKWLLRWYNKQTQRYKVETLATADDTADANGSDVLNWKQAQGMARERAEKIRAEQTGGHIGHYTVADAMGDYFDALDLEGRDTKAERNRAALYITPPDSLPVDFLNLSKSRLADLTAGELRRWLAGVAAHPGFTQSHRVRKVPEFEAPEDEADYWRRRKDSANRLLGILKAGLNFAFDSGKVTSNAAWSGKRVKAFETVGKRRPGYLTLSECERLVNAAAPGFRELVQGALYTGARYGDLAYMDVRDFAPSAGVVMSGNSKSGKPHPVHLSDEGVAFFRRITQGRDGGEPMFPGPKGRRWGKSQQSRPMAEAMEAARIKTHLTFHGLRHTYATQAVMAGVPLVVVAQNLGHSDTRMVERHYGHLADSWVREQVQAIPSLKDVGADETVVGIDDRRASSGQL